MLKVVIFDLNGIFIKSPKLSDRFEKDFGVKSEVFTPKLSEIMESVRKPGAGKAFKYWEPVLKEWNVNLSEQELWDYWFKEEQPVGAMISFARELKERGVKVFILSNNFKERADYYGHYPWIHDVVDKVYFSWQTGFVKPDPGAWGFILSENNLSPEECLYFDDKEKNVKSAESVGIKSVLFTGEEVAREAIANFPSA